jgi:hypothetical protein
MSSWQRTREGRIVGVDITPTSGLMRAIYLISSATQNKPEFLSFGDQLINVSGEL